VRLLRTSIAAEIVNLQEDLTVLAGFNVHTNQAYTETLANVEDALPNRQGLDIKFLAWTVFLVVYPLEIVLIPF
jgi:hypothetical protein